MNSKKFLISSVLIASMALAGCNTAAPAETSATDSSASETTAETTAESTEASTDATEATDATSDTSASEDTSATEDSKSQADSGFAKYEEVTKLIKEYIDADAEDPDSKLFTIGCDPTGMVEQIKEGKANDLRYALYDVDKDGTEELFVLKFEYYGDENAENREHSSEVLDVFTIGSDGNPVGVTAGWTRNRLQFLKDGRFYRVGSANAVTIIMEYQEMDPATKQVTSKETYFTDGTRDDEGNLVLFQAKDPTMPAFNQGTDENVGAYEEPQIADDIYKFDDSISFGDFYAQ